MTDETTFDRVGSLDPRDAAAEALAQLLRDRLEARVFGGKAVDRAVRLTHVFTEWPDEYSTLNPPCAAISDALVELDDFDPVDDDESYDDGEGRALRVQEAQGEFSVDLWGSDREERKALKAAFAAVFRMGRSRGGASVLVPLPDEALPPEFRGKAKPAFVVRLSVARPPRNLEDGDAVANDTWRAQALVAWEAELVTAVDAVRLDAVFVNVDLTEH